MCFPESTSVLEINWTTTTIYQKVIFKKANNPLQTKEATNTYKLKKIKSFKKKQESRNGVNTREREREVTEKMGKESGIGPIITGNQRKIVMKNWVKERVFSTINWRITQHVKRRHIVSCYTSAGSHNHHQKTCNENKWCLSLHSSCIFLQLFRKISYHVSFAFILVN